MFRNRLYNFNKQTSICERTVYSVMYDKCIRNSLNEVSRNHNEFEKILINDPNYLYEGGCEDYEDPADYTVPRSVPKGVRIA
jgi:hypothetical protein